MLPPIVRTSLTTCYFARQRVCNNYHLSFSFFVLEVLSFEIPATDQCW